MKQRTSRLLSAVLVLCMVLALLPGTALAADIPGVNYDTIDIYTENKNVWRNVKSWRFFGEYFYGLFDLEGDGIPEMFVTQVQGSGHFSVNYYYKIDVGTRSVYEITEYPDGWDVIDLDYCLKIYRDDQTNQLFYYSYDYARAGMGYYGIDYSFLYFQNGAASIKPLWWENHNGDSIEFYYYTGSGDQVKVSEPEWERYQNEYLGQYTLLTESLTKISSSEMNKATGEKLSNLLRGMYDELYQSIGAVSGAPAAPDTGTFSDVPSSHWCYDSLSKAAGKGLIQGVGDNKFAPESKLSRASFVTLIVRLVGGGEPADVSGEWYEKYYAYANEHDLFAGIGVNTGPNADIPRYEMAQMIYNAAKAKGMDVSASKEFTDSDHSYDASYDTAIGYAYATGLLTGKDGGDFAGADTLTRAEAAAVVWRFYELANAA